VHLRAALGIELHEAFGLAGDLRGLSGERGRTDFARVVLNPVGAVRPRDMRRSLWMQFQIDHLAPRGLARSGGRGALSATSPPVLRRVLGLMFGPTRPVFPVPDCWRIRWA